MYWLSSSSSPRLIRTLGLIIALPIAPIQSSFSAEDSHRKKNEIPLVSTRKEFSLLTSSSAERMFTQSRTGIFSVGVVVYAFGALKVNREPGVNTAQRLRHDLKYRDRFSTQPSLRIVSKDSAIYKYYRRLIKLDMTR